MSLSIEWPGGAAHLDGVAIEQIAGACGTPLYLYSESALQRQFDSLHRALPGIEIYYSVKANPHAKIIAFFLQQGAGCEIASGGEYALARRAGAAPDRIVFAGPGKGREELEYVVTHGIGEIHLESFDEIELLDGIAKRHSRPVNVALRINPSAAFGGGLLMGGQPTAFGFEEESLEQVVSAVTSRKSLVLRGVHLYTGTQILDADVLLKHWHHAVDVAKKTAELAGQPIATIDLGGGLGIPYFAHEKDLNLDVLAHGTRALLTEARSDVRLKSTRFVVEPGRFLSGPAGIYIARVRSVKSCRGSTFVVVDGGMNHNLAASGNLGQVVRRDYPIFNLSRNSGEPKTVVVVGPLCTPIDTLGRKVMMPPPKTGDLIGILQSGAYGLTASPSQFLSHPTPAEVLVRPGQYELITPRHMRFEAAQTVCASD
ncbi:MAG TPA: type III PLP-dependent enzyme [Terriglobales bacterium]